MLMVTLSDRSTKEKGLAVPILPASRRVRFFYVQVNDAIERKN